jgi:hypothetical protein
MFSLLQAWIFSRKRDYQSHVVGAALSAGIILPMVLALGVADLSEGLSTNERNALDQIDLASPGFAFTGEGDLLVEELSSVARGKSAQGNSIAEVGSSKVRRTTVY